ncbi:hypothetical protein B4N84_10760 [Flavobacterium sp. IR1]|nr:hypothetical protein B4N84_10760 [Flavobacterium sp. IR1]
MIEKKINDSGVIFLNKNFIVIKNFSKLLIYNEYFEKLFDYPINPVTNHVIKSIDDTFIVFDNMLSVFVKDGIKQDEQSRYYYKYNSNCKIYTRVDDHENIEFETLDYKFKCSVSNSRKLFLKEYYIQSHYEEKCISNISLKDGKTIWQLSFSKILDDEKASSDSDILEVNNKLYFIALGTNSGGLFCVDINSGKVLMHYPGVSRFLVKDENYIYSSKYENILCKINPVTNEMEEWDVNELVKDNGFENIHDHRCTAYNGLVYFTQTLGDNKAKFGILDTNKKELVYKYDFEPKNGGIGSIQVNNNRIFIHTQDKTLHIFEKDKDLE